MNGSKSSFRQTWDDKIEVGALAAPLSAVYRFNPQLPKPCVHPFFTAKGIQLSGFEMSDHVWHRGLWFTIKFINGTNFWEEHPPFGIQTTESQPAVEWIAPDSIRITHNLNWNSAATGQVISEKRTITFRSDPGGSGIIDWNSRLLALQDLTLDRTPFTTWGGYGGLTYRASRELHNSTFILPNGETATALTGQPHDWILLQSSVDNGPKQRVSLGMIEHPSNPRSPSPWYAKCNNDYTFLNAAFLFHEPMNVKREQTLNFNYRVIYRDDVWNPEKFSSIASAYRNSEVAK